MEILPKPVLTVNLGGGVNSTAMLIRLRKLDIVPDAILFADTLAEFPETYAHIKVLSSWLENHSMPPVTTVCFAENSKHDSLEAECLTSKSLPSRAYGGSRCSLKWKRDPIHKWINNWDVAREAWERGEKITRAIGIDWGEAHRADNAKDDAKHHYWHPLVEWEMDREACVQEIKDAGMETPSKSACFFCPSSSKSEIRVLMEKHPNLFDRAVALERNSEGTNQSVKGLGRDWSWEALGKAEEAQLRLFPDIYSEMPCMCFDGEE